MAKRKSGKGKRKPKKKAPSTGRGGARAAKKSSSKFGAKSSKPGKRKSAKKKSTRSTSSARPIRGERPSNDPPSSDRPSRARAASRRSSRRVERPAYSQPTGEQRLQKFLATAGFGSRRSCEELIEEARVSIDGQTVTKLGTKVDPQSQEIKVDGNRVRLPDFKYFILNKPTGILSTAKDPSGRPRVIDLIKSEQRVYNVGRLDKSSEGLILVTNDGELANRLTHPRYGIHKTYHVLVDGIPEVAKLRSLEEGVYLADGKARVTNIKIRKRQKGSAWLEIVLDEGRNREIRRLLARVGHKVRRLRRVAIGPLRLGDLPVGAHRELTLGELRDIRKELASGGTKKVSGRTTKKKTAKSANARPVSKRGGKKVEREKSRIPIVKVKGAGAKRRGKGAPKGRKPRKRT